MKQPRDLSGREFSRLLSKHFGYEVVRQVGSHITMTTHFMGEEHHLTIPLHDPLKPGMLSALLSEVATYMKTDKKRLMEKLFG
ncbi:MAG: type II toxin-antitoxin system HicA family toxin [Nitrospinae bacterium]|nr:type II toxin-antitoxin system HicA family toxin [Nitrospinota bacterium]